MIIVSLKYSLAGESLKYEKKNKAKQLSTGEMYEASCKQQTLAKKNS